MTMNVLQKLEEKHDYLGTVLFCNKYVLYGTKVDETFDLYEASY